MLDSSAWGGAQAAPQVEEPSPFASEDFEQQWAESANSMLGEALGSGDPYVELARGSLSPTQERVSGGVMRRWIKYVGKGRRVGGGLDVSRGVRGWSHHCIFCKHKYTCVD